VLEVIHDYVTTPAEQRAAHRSPLRRRTPVRLLLVRHAEPRGAKTLAEDGLTDRGRAQAAALGIALLALAPSRVIASPTPRATETAACAGLPFEVDPAFEKFNYGGGEVRERHEASGPLWRPEDRAALDGESLGEFHERVARGLDSLIDHSADGDTVVVIAHGGIIQVGMRYAWGLGASDPWLTEPATPLASITEIEFGRPPPEATRPAVRIVRLGDSAHLAAVE